MEVPGGAHLPFCPKEFVQKCVSEGQRINASKYLKKFVADVTYKSLKWKAEVCSVSEGHASS